MHERDRLAFAFRVAGTIIGAAVIVTTFATSSWENSWVVGLVVLVTVGGALSYHLLTSIVRCPGCTARVFNFRIASADASRKVFACRKCGTPACLAEGFYWQQDVAG